MRALVLIHRWLGIAFCLLFAMWFASGIVMHFVAFPALTDAERVAGLAPVDSTLARHTPADAVKASGIDATRVRLVARTDGLVYIVEGAADIAAIHADALTRADIVSESAALAIAVDHARRRGLTPGRAAFAGLASYDQWTVPNGLDPHRPLYRVALNDAAGTELYVSSRTGEVVRDTGRAERAWNYAGSVVHWIYPTALRRNWRAWDMTVWTLSLAAFIGAMAGALLGVLRVRVSGRRAASPFQGWHAWHHWLGLVSMTFVLTWISSGWLSMDHGRLFSTGKPTRAEVSAVTGVPRWHDAAGRKGDAAAPDVREIEWFPLEGRIYRRERSGSASQQLFLAGEPAVPTRAFLRPDEVSAAAVHLAAGCRPAAAVEADDAYPVVPAMPGAPVYRAVCGGTWFHVDGASGAVLEKLDPSRRAYRWFYSALHVLDFPVLVSRPSWRTALIVVLCALGFVFSSTGVVIGWRRLASRAAAKRTHRNTQRCGMALALNLLVPPIEETKMTTQDKEHGEGNYKASKEYNDATKKFVESGKVDEAAEKAKPKNQNEAREMKDAEEVGKSRAKP